MTNIALVQARVSSSRLPGKVLKKVKGISLLEYQINRLKMSREISRIIIVTSCEASDYEIENLCQNKKIEFFRGDLDNVLDRFYCAVQDIDCDNIIRITGDCPLIDPWIVDEVIKTHQQGNYDYTTNAITPSYPDGMDVEVFTKEALKKAWGEASTNVQKEHVTPYINTNPQIFKLKEVINEKNQGHYRFTVDEPEDFQLIEKIIKFFENNDYRLDDIINVVDANNWQEINKKYSRNEGFEKSIREEIVMNLKDRYKKSTALYEMTKEVIPLASQTFSKSVTQLSLGTSPLFATKAKGAYLWDVDGNRYIDFVNALLSVNLGYRYEAVDNAVIEQIQNSGVNFSLPHQLESDVAKKIIEMVPCAEMVRFGKNGTDATSAAIRISRAFTGKTKIAVCGYHGWQDWYIGRTTMNKGVPEQTANLTSRFNFNDIDSLKEIFTKESGDIAAVIMEPMNIEYPKDQFLEKVKEVCVENGAVLIFDEMITGFRFAKGGAQELFGVTPDLATFGKGLANGYPLSAIVGKKEIMMEMEKVFFSGTFGGETVSLAAANKVLEILETENVTDKIKGLGESLMKRLEDKIKFFDLENVFEVKGHPAWSFITFKDVGSISSHELKSYYQQEMLRRNIFILATHNLSYSHTESDLDILLEAYDDFFKLVKDIISKDSIDGKIEANVIKPLFTVR